MHLAEDLPGPNPYQDAAYNPTGPAWPALSSGQVIALAELGEKGGIAPGFRAYTADFLELGLNIEARPGGHIPEHTNHPSGYPHWTTPKPQGLDLPYSKREGLDSPQFRSGQDGARHHENIITDTHIGSVIFNGNRVLKPSTQGALVTMSEMAAAASGFISKSIALEWSPSVLTEGGSTLSMADFDPERAPGGGLRYEVYLASGLVLPDWLSFDPDTAVITVNDHSALVEECRLIVKRIHERGWTDIRELIVKPVLDEELLGLDSGEPFAPELGDDWAPAPDLPPNAVEAFQDLWLTEAAPDADGSEADEPPSDSDLNQKISLAPNTMDSLTRAARAWLDSFFS